MFSKFNEVENTIGLIVNPRSGGDIRRAVAAAARSTLEDKVSIVRRIVLGAIATGVRMFMQTMNLCKLSEGQLKRYEILRSFM